MQQEKYALVIDNEAYYRRKFANALSKLRFKVKWVRSRAEALNYLDKTSPTPHVALVHFNSEPAVTRQFLAELFKKYYEMVLVYPTIYKKDADMALDVGAFDVVLKNDGVELTEEFERKIERAYSESLKRRIESDVFVAMPFDKKLNRHYRHIKTYLRLQGIRCQRADDKFQPGTVMAQVKQYIDKAEYILADLTGKNSNVCYEIGYAHGRGKDVILLADQREGWQEIPFDLRAENFIAYDQSNLDEALLHAVKCIRNAHRRKKQSKSRVNTKGIKGHPQS